MKIEVDRECVNCSVPIAWGMACHECVRAFAGGIGAAIAGAIGHWLYMRICS